MVFDYYAFAFAPIGINQQVFEGLCRILVYMGLVFLLVTQSPINERSSITPRLTEVKSTFSSCMLLLPMASSPH